MSPKLYLFNKTNSETTNKEIAFEKRVKTLQKGIKKEINDIYLKQIKKMTIVRDKWKDFKRQ